MTGKQKESKKIKRSWKEKPHVVFTGRLGSISKHFVQLGHLLLFTMAYSWIFLEIVYFLISL
jgi:hypothetical protein